MLQIRYLTLIFTSFCMGLSACTPTVDIPTASPSITPTTTISPTPTTTAVPPAPTSELSMNLILQEEDLEASGYVLESKEDGTIVLWDHDEGSEHEAFRLNPDGSAVFWGIKPGEGGIEEGQIGEEVVFLEEQMQGYQVAFEPTLRGGRAKVILKDENRKVVSYYRDDVNSWRAGDGASSFVPMGQEIFTQMFGSGGEENKAAIVEWVKLNWGLGEKDKVELSGKNEFITISFFDEETGKREVKFFSLITGRESFDTKVAENYASNRWWESDPDYPPTHESKVTVMGYVEGLTDADGNLIPIPLSFGAGQHSDIIRMVPSQEMANALAKGYLEAYWARYMMQTGEEYTWEEYLVMLQKGQGAPTVPQLNEDAPPNSYSSKFTKGSQFNPLAGVAIVFADNRNISPNLPVKIAVPGLTIKNHIDVNGRLVVVANIESMSVTYHFAKGEVKTSNPGKVTAGEIFAVGITTFPARIIGYGPDRCMRDDSTGGRECREIFFSDMSDKFIDEIKELTVGARKNGMLTKSLLLDFKHRIPPQRY